MEVSFIEPAACGVLQSILPGSRSMCVFEGRCTCWCWLRVLDVLQRCHGVSVEYGGGGHGPCPPAFAARVPDVIAMDIPALAPSTVATMANVLALDTCPREVKRLIVTIIQSFCVVPHNRRQFKVRVSVFFVVPGFSLFSLVCCTYPPCCHVFQEELLRVVVDLAAAAQAHVASTCAELTTCLVKQRSPDGGTKVLPRIPAESPQCDRRLVDVVEVSRSCCWFLKVGIPSGCRDDALLLCGPPHPAPLQVLLALPSEPMVDVIAADGSRQRLMLVRGEHRGPAASLAPEAEGHWPSVSSQSSRHWVPASATDTTVDVELRALPELASLFSALHEALTLASHFESVENPSADPADGVSHAVSDLGVDLPYSSGTMSAAVPGGPVGTVARQRARTFSILEPPMAVSATMDTMSKRFRSLLRAFFLAHPVGDLSPCKTRERDGIRARLVDAQGARSLLKRAPSASLLSPGPAGGGLPLSSTPATAGATADQLGRGPSEVPVDRHATSVATARHRLVQFVETHSAVLNSAIASHPELLMVCVEWLVHVSYCIVSLGVLGCHLTVRCLHVPAT